MSSHPVVEEPTVAPAELRGARVGFVGAGQIGLPMVRRLVDAGAHVRAHARRPEARAALAAAGAEVVTELREVGPGNDRVVSCLFSDAQLDAVIPDLRAGLERGTVLVSHTTGSPATTRALGAALAADGIAVVEAPFSGTPTAIAAGKLTVLLAGDPADLDRAEITVRAYAGTVLRTGALGTALVLKLLNNVMFTANVQLALDLARVADELALPLPDVLSVLEQSSGNTRALGYLSVFGTGAALREEVEPFLRKDIAVSDEVVAGLGIDLGLLGEVAHGRNLDLDATG